jgi:D-aminopeptidase
LAEGGFTLGCLVVPNYGARRDLHMLLGPDAEAADSAAESADGESEVDPGGGSIMIVLGTDAPLSDRQLRRLAVRASFGLGRAGSFASSGSGEYAIAFSTAYRVPHRSPQSTLDLRLLRDDSAAMRELFEAAGDATQEAILDSLCAAEAMSGRDGRRVAAFPHELLPAAMGSRRG